MSTVGEMIRTMRQQAGMTQTQLADAAKLSYHTIRNVELGRYSPNLDTITRIAEGLGCTSYVVLEPNDPDREVTP